MRFLTLQDLTKFWRYSVAVIAVAASWALVAIL